MSSNGSKSRGSGSSGSGSGSGGKANEQSLSPSDISAALWAFAVLQHQPEALLAGDDRRRRRKSKRAPSLRSWRPRPQRLPAAAAPLLPPPPPPGSAAAGLLQLRLLPSATAATAVIRPRDLASSLWALAVLGRVSGGAFAAGLGAALALGTRRHGARGGRGAVAAAPRRRGGQPVPAGDADGRRRCGRRRRRRRSRCSAGAGWRDWDATPRRRGN